MKAIVERAPTLLPLLTHYCPGCGHGIIHRLLAEIIHEENIRHRTIGLAPVGCAVMAYRYIDVDMSEAAHGRTPAVATGLKRVHPGHIVFSYQGDGDLAAIGTAEIIHAAHRGEQIAVIFINNAVFGMTGGQMAPTTVLGQVTATTQQGRKAVGEGHPLQVCELLSVLPGAIYIERCSVYNPAQVRKTKKAVKHAFELQLDGAQGLSMVEVLSPCPTYWRMTPAKAMEWIEKEMTKAFPLGRFKG